MSLKFAEGMDLFDNYNEAWGELFKKLNVPLTAGTLELAPLPSESRLLQLLENGFLRGPVGASVPPVAAPVVAEEPDRDAAMAITEPLGVPEEVVEAAEE